MRRCGGAVILAVLITLGALGSSQALAQADVSPSPRPGEGVPDAAGRLVFGRITGQGQFGEQLMALYAMDPDGTDLVQLTGGDSYFATWSPDGRHIAFTQYQPGGSAQVAVMAADGTELRILTSGTGIHEAASWSPDGTWLAYDASPLLPGDPAFHTVLYRMDVDGSNQALLGRPDTFDFEPRISPDGTSLLFQRYHAADSTGPEAEPLLIRDLATGAERVLTADEAINPAWSPVGTWIVAQTAPANPDWEWGPLVRIATDGSSSDWTVLYPATATTGGFKPVFSPDGAHIAFGCGDGVGSPSYDEGICVMGADGSDVGTLVDDPHADENEVSWGVAAQ